METQLLLKKISRWVTFFLFGYAYFMADPVFAGVTAEYKCTTDCNLCITFDGKKTICSEKYADDSDQYEFAKKIGRLVNDGLLIPTPDLKVGFALGAFAKKFFNCELMVKKAEQIKQATDNMCKKSSTAYRERESSLDRPSRGVASVKSPRSLGPVSSKEKSAGGSIREIKKAKKAVKESSAPVKAEASEELTPPPAAESMDDLIRQMDE